MRSISLTSVVTMLLLSGACKGTETTPKAAEPAKAPAVEAPNPDAMVVAEGDAADAGPVPPETSMVFMAVEGSFLPLACFAKDRGKLLTGDECMKLVPEGAEVRAGSKANSSVFKVGAATEPLCLAGQGRKLAFAAEGMTAEGTLGFAVWPRAAFKTVTAFDQETWDETKVRLSTAEAEALLAAAKQSAGVDGEIKAHQVASGDLDGNGTADKFFSVFVPDPKNSERYVWSGLFVAADGKLDALTLLESAKSKADVYEIRGFMDLDGNGTRELWLRLVFEDGGGERIYEYADGKAKPLGQWSCGA